MPTKTTLPEVTLYQALAALALVGVIAAHGVDSDQGGTVRPSLAVKEACDYASAMMTAIGPDSQQK